MLKKLFFALKLKIFFYKHLETFFNKNRRCFEIIPKSKITVKVKCTIILINTMVQLQKE